MDKLSGLNDTRASKNLHIKDVNFSNGVNCGVTYCWINPDTNEEIPICTRSLDVASSIALQFDDVFYFKNIMNSI
ncbi:hypothetical protein MNBD_GAMMA12-1782 [hydrothermal vent metagenome]|uniref:Uncharacterized protein n=1 Tax=hydrothermal vent metagenome TaxID=652676 RepID=A0A3B0Y936_9ZZZZ